MEFDEQHFPLAKSEKNFRLCGKYTEQKMTFMQNYVKANVNQNPL